jgi:hypothetical protein
MGTMAKPTSNSGIARGMAQWLNKRKGNDKKRMESNIMSSEIRFGVCDLVHGADRAKIKMKLYSETCDKVYSPLEVLVDPLLVEGVVHTVKHRRTKGGD